MKGSLLVDMQEKIMARSKKPWACFETSGVEDGQLGISIRWNKAFIASLHAQGVQGQTDEETIQLFFMFMSSRIADDATGGADVVNPSGTPTLTNEANRFVK